MSTLQERLRAAHGTCHELEGPCMRWEAADALDAAAIDLSEAKRAWRYERDRADAAQAKLDAIDAFVQRWKSQGALVVPLGSIDRILHPEAGNR